MTEEYIRGYENATREAVRTVLAQGPKWLAETIKRRASGKIEDARAEMNARAEALRELARLGQEYDAAPVTEWYVDGKLAHVGPTFEPPKEGSVSARVAGRADGWPGQDGGVD